MADLILPKGKNCEGYLWPSDESTPIIINGEYEGISLSKDTNPFIVEGMLKIDNISYSIRYVDGEYLINKNDISQYDENEVITFIPNDIKEKEKEKKGEDKKKNSWTDINGSKVVGLKFLKKWSASEDELCNNFPVLEFCNLIFVGFETKKQL